MGKLTEDDNAPEGEEYVITETPPEPEQEAQPEEEAPVAEASADEEIDDGEDERLEADSDEDEEPQGRKRPQTPEEKRAQRQNRKFRRRAAIEHKERELAFLRAENEEFKRRLQSVEQQTAQFNVNAVDQRLNETVNEIETVNRIIAKAIEQGQGEDVAKALSIRDQLQEKQRQLASAKQQAEAAPKKNGPDPRVAAYAKEWIRENQWYDPSGKDEDSAIVKVLDQRLAQEGYNPASEDYWIELSNRVAARLPHRFEEGAVEKPKPAARKAGGPPVGGKREYAPPSTRKEVYISPERKQALLDAGVWDDPQLRQKYIKRYAEYDRNNSSR